MISYLSFSYCRDLHAYLQTFCAKNGMKQTMLIFMDGQRAEQNFLTVRLLQLFGDMAHISFNVELL